MSPLIELSPAEFLLGLSVFGMLLLLLTFVPVQILSKLRRNRRKYNRKTCRICGYRYLRRNPGITECPHCGAKN